MKYLIAIALGANLTIWLVVAHLHSVPM